MNSNRFPHHHVVSNYLLKNMLLLKVKRSFLSWPAYLKWMCVILWFTVTSVATASLSTSGWRTTTSRYTVQIKSEIEFKNRDSYEKKRIHDIFGKLLKSVFVSNETKVRLQWRGWKNVNPEKCITARILGFKPRSRAYYIGRSYNCSNKIILSFSVYQSRHFQRQQQHGGFRSQVDKMKVK